MNLIELKSTIRDAYPYRIELHAHTSPASSCGRAAPEEMIRAYKNVGFDAVTVTNHFLYQSGDEKKSEYIDRYLDDFYRAEACGNSLGVKVYLGAEIRFVENANDYLVFGVNRQLLEEIYEFLPYGVENFRKEFSMPQSVFIQAHPRRDGIVQIDPELLDGIEIFNMHPNHNSRNGMTSSFAKEQGVWLVTAGSDFHHPNKGHEGLAALLAPTLPDDSFSLAKLMQEKNYLLEFAGERIIFP